MCVRRIERISGPLLSNIQWHLTKYLFLVSSNLQIMFITGLLKHDDNTVELVRKLVYVALIPSLTTR